MRGNKALKVSRYLTHAIVLGAALAVSGFASETTGQGSSLALRLGVVNAAGQVGGAGGAVGSVSLGRTTTIIKPVAVPTEAPRSHAPAAYTAVEGDTIKSLAARFGISEDSIRWSNFDLLKRTDKDVAGGNQLVIPPVSGIVVTVTEGDTAASVAARFKVETQAVVDFNYLRDPDHLQAGDRLVVPGGTGPEFEQPPAPIRPAFTAAVPARSAYAVSVGGPGPGANTSTEKFPYGYCTWYVNSRRPVPWLGNAWEWFGNAQRAGWVTGASPKPGAIMVTWESGFGHVAIVDRVNPDGSFAVSEMNFVGYGVVSQRTIRTGQVPLIGFIY